MIAKLARTPFLIAEIGASHDGKLPNAHTLIAKSAHCGFDAVKIQYYDARRLAARRRAESYLDKYLPYQVPKEWLPILRDEAHENDKRFVVSVYDEQGLDEAEPFADMLKVSSFESGDDSLLQAATQCGKPVIVSTGMATEMELLQLRAFRVTAQSEVILLHCISAYPAPVDELDLAVIKSYELDGFSDHSGNYFMGAIAVAAGAKVIEVHVKDESTSKDNPDLGHSLSLDGLFGLRSYAARYVEAAHVAARAIGCGRRQVNECEIPATAYKVRV